MAANLERRKRVMARSVKLGHCVCDPAKPCPCDLLKEHNVCQCAGERLPAKTADVALTKLVHKAGCASKIGQADLLRILSKLPPVNDPNVLVGAAAGDDAGIYRLDDRRALVQTVDVFTPCVDDPYLFGRIAAANSLSDVYAMGGTPLTALSIVGFPIDELDGSIMEAILRGGMDTLTEAGCALIGGHSINDPEIKCGFAITGLIETGKAVERDQARAGDALVLTKPLGTGIVSFAAQIGRADAAALEAAGASMAELNRDAAELMTAHRASACTDITGYGLAGHLVQMARGSGVNAEIDLARLPVLPGVAACIADEVLPGAVERNQEFAMAWVDADPDEPLLPLLYDPQTSGGLLVALPEEEAPAYVDALRARGHDAAAIIGRVVPLTPGQAEGHVVVASRDAVALPNTKEVPAMSETNEAACCGDVPQAEPHTTECEALAAFTSFMKEANKPGAVDARTKKLISVALSVVQRCAPCLKIHMKGALAMGISLAEMDEAANLAIAFGGCTAMMFYKEIRETFPAA